MDSLIKSHLVNHRPIHHSLKKMSRQRSKIKVKKVLKRVRANGTEKSTRLTRLDTPKIFLQQSKVISLQLNRIIKQRVSKIHQKYMESHQIWEIENRQPVPIRFLVLILALKKTFKAFKADQLEAVTPGRILETNSTTSSLTCSPRRHRAWKVMKLIKNNKIIKKWRKTT